MKEEDEICNRNCSYKCYPNMFFYFIKEYRYQKALLHFHLALLTPLLPGIPKITGSAMTIHLPWVLSIMLVPTNLQVHSRCTDVHNCFITPLSGDENMKWVLMYELCLEWYCNAFSSASSCFIPWLYLSFIVGTLV